MKRLVIALCLAFSVTGRAAAQSYRWTGAGADNQWTTDANWFDNSSPYHTFTAHDIVLGTDAAVALRNTVLSANLFVNSVAISATGYTVSNSNGATLSVNPTQTNAVSMVVNSGIGAAVTAPIQFTGAPGSSQTIAVDVSSSMTLGGSLSTSPGVSLLKSLPGTLTLSGNNTGITGGINVAAGTLQLGSPTAAGSATSQVVVSNNGSNGSLDLNGQSGIANPLTLNGIGSSNVLGALGNSATATASVSGNVALDSDATIGNGGITLSGQVSDLGAGHTLTKDGIGQLTLSNPAGNVYRSGTVVTRGTLVVSNTSNSGTGSGPVNVSGNLLGSGRLAGTGIVSGAVIVDTPGTIRGGDPAAPLTASNTTLTVNGGLTVTGGGVIEEAFTSSGGAVTNPTLVQFAGGLNLGKSVDNPPVSFKLSAAHPLMLSVTDVAGSGLQVGLPVALTLASGTGGMTLNGVAFPAGSTTINTTLYSATFSGFGVDPAATTLVASGTSGGPWALTLHFTPVPEPATVLGLAVAGFGLARLVRRSVATRRPIAPYAPAIPIGTGYPSGNVTRRASLPLGRTCPVRSAGPCWR